MPIPRPGPKELPDEGTRYGYIKSTRIRQHDLTINKGKDNEEHGVIIYEARVNIVVPDDSDHVDVEAIGTIFIHTDENYSDQNWAYEQFLTAVGADLVSITMPDGEEQEMLPDPLEDGHIGKLVQVQVKHLDKSYKGRQWTEAAVVRWNSWDGTDPDTGEELDIRVPRDPWDEEKEEEESSKADFSDDKVEPSIDDEMPF